MWRGAVAVAALGGCPLGARASTCSEKDPYSEEPNPWGWPLSPNDWSFGETSCWTEKFAMCGGGAQSPVDFSTCEGATAQPDSEAVLETNYKTHRPDVKVSKYMRSAMMEGDFGTLTVRVDGVESVLTATSVHVVAPAMHKMASVVGAVAEVFVVHKDEAAYNTEHKFVVTSTLIVEGAESALLTAMGVSDPANAGKDSWTMGASTNFQEMLGPGSENFLSYHGSMPVPPCWETVQWLVSKETVTATAEQVAALGQILEDATGSATGRQASMIACDRVGNTMMPDGADMEPHSCTDMAKEDQLLTSQCWAELGTCDKSPVDLPPAALETGADWDLMAHAHYEDSVTVTANRSKYTLDFTADHGFGHLDIHGWQFQVTEIKVKAISMHTLHDHTIYAGELVIVHELFGDSLQNTTGPKHKVMISIPLQIGTASAMLHDLGMHISNKEAVRHGNSYIQEDFSLGKHLEKLFADGASWYWYSGGPVLEPGVACPDWGARWLVFDKPMTVSLTQLNILALQVSGMDSTQSERVAAPSTWMGSLPSYAVDKGDDAECAGSSSDNYSYNYVNCWPTYTLPGDVENKCGSTAATGRSPIDITTGSVAGTDAADFLSRVNWKPMAGLKVEVHNHASLTVSTLSERLGYAMLYDAKEGGFPGFYQITNLALHMPSEHTVDGKHFAGEFQVHMSKQFTDFDLATDDALAASFLFEVGEEGNILVEQLLHAAKDDEHGNTMGTLDLMQTLGPAMDPANGGDFYSYKGGFTTPDMGCAPVVKWLVFTSPMHMSQAQVNAFRALVPSPGNNRPIQDVSTPIYKNSFDESTLPKYDFYLSRTDGRDRVKKPTGMILLPVFGSVILAIAVMFATFNHQDNKTKKNKAGGLMEEAGATVGNASM